MAASSRRGCPVSCCPYFLLPDFEPRGEGGKVRVGGGGSRIHSPISCCWDKFHHPELPKRLAHQLPGTWGKAVTEAFSAIARTAAESVPATEMGAQGTGAGLGTVPQIPKPTTFNDVLTGTKAGTCLLPPPPSGNGTCVSSPPGPEPHPDPCCSHFFLEALKRPEELCSWVGGGHGQRKKREE